jgi:CRP-like cAMP-binding protein
VDFQQTIIKSITKGSILLEPGQYCKVGYRVLKGCLRSYVIDTSGKSHILQFAPENWVISDLESYSNKTPSKIFIDAIEDSQLEVISDKYLDTLEDLDKSTLIEIHIKFRNNLIATHNRLISLLSGTAEEKYLEFIKIYPNLIQRIPQKLIASYLGMTPEHLSYIRNKISKKPDLS